MYIRPHFRDCLQWRAENLAMSTTSDSAVKLYDSAIQQMFLYKSDEELGGLTGTVDKMLQADPNFVMAKVISCGWPTFQSNARISNEITTKIEQLREVKEKESINEREKMHCEAIIEMGLGNRSKASQIWEEILMLYPRDLLALKFVFINYILTGNTVMLRDTVSRMLPYWKRTDPEYGYILNLYAFGLEETNLYAEAEKNLLEGLTLAPDDPWGAHSAAHIYESTCRFQKSADTLLKSESSWGSRGFSCHIYWHLSNVYVETNSFDKALDLFDEHVGPSSKQDKDVFAVNDACQLLQKLEFEGVDVGDRWEDVYDSYSSYAPASFACYDDALRLLSFPKSKMAVELQKGKELIELAEKYIKSSNDYNSRLCEEVGLDVMKGVLAYTEGRFDEAVELLYPQKYQFVRLGGSYAQRDIFDLLLINACLNSKTQKSMKIGRCLLYERKSCKSDSPLTERLLARSLAAHLE